MSHDNINFVLKNGAPSMLWCLRHKVVASVAGKRDGLDGRFRSTVSAGLYYSSSFQQYSNIKQQVATPRPRPITRTME